ncbi:MAG: glycogen debranching protein GlgX [Spirochaetia bacterium]
MRKRITKKIHHGKHYPLGADVKPDGVNFALFSKNATAVYLCLFQDPEDENETDVIPMTRGPEYVWHVFVEAIGKGVYYGYRVEGPYLPAQGHRFNPNKLLLDPYAKAVTHKAIDKDGILFGYSFDAKDKDLSLDSRNSASLMPKCIVWDNEFDWQQDEPLDHPIEELIIYETHVKGFTANTNSGVENPGTYLGFIEKIPYLKEIGVNAVELLPVQEFFIRPYLVENGLTEYWGYNTIGFFTPESSYSTGSYPGCQIDEFKTLVRELHKAGIEVILDVVYNHTGEGNELGPTLSMKGIDNDTYYFLTGEDKQQKRYYRNDAGSGNILHVENFPVLKLIMDSLRYWITEMHVDGFRFDLASVLARMKGEYHDKSSFFAAVAQDPVVSRTKLIAEPWDISTYQVGNFPSGWSEWNGKFRDTVRQFVKGDPGQVKYLARRVSGSADLYSDDGRSPYNSINFVTCHDGFTLWDLYSYNEKHNAANMEDNRDGADHNFSWNCGVEGETTDLSIIILRKRLVKNALCLLLFSMGTPMVLSGDECLRTQGGNNNGYCQDNEISWFNWDAVDNNREIFNFFKKAVEFRKHYPAMKRKKFLTGDNQDNNGVPDISWYNQVLKDPDWEDEQNHLLIFQLDGNEVPSENGDYHLLFIYNAYSEPKNVMLPTDKLLSWYRVVDTFLPREKDFLTEGEAEPVQDYYHAGPRSVVVLVGRKGS